MAEVSGLEDDMKKSNRTSKKNYRQNTLRKIFVGMKEIEGNCSEKY